MITQANSFRIPMKDNSVHCAVSSFPYWGLRSYDLPPIILGGRDDCRHVWQTVVKHRESGGPQIEQTKSGKATTSIIQAQRDTESQICSTCGAFYGSFGLEPTMSLHVANAVIVSREIKRVLHPTGTFWLNYGDSFATARNGRSAADGKATGNDDRTFRDKPFSTAGELPEKNLCGIPWRVAIALQEDGWILRAAPPWIKRNAMPESVQDRPGNAHEYVFMLTKGKKYYYDVESVRRASVVKSQDEALKRAGNYGAGYDKWVDSGGYRGNGGLGENIKFNPAGRALRTSDFFFDCLDSYIAHLQSIRDNGGMLLDSTGMPEALIVNPTPYRFAHFATFPPALVSPMIQASTSQAGVCPKCGNPWQRVKEPTPEYAALLGKDWADYEQDAIEGRGHSVSPQRPTKRNGASVTAAYQTTGWKPSCDCIKKATPNYGMQGGELLEIVEQVAQEFAPIPAVILDPFCGSGTVGQVCNELGRRFIGLDLNPVYLSENALPRSEGKTSQKSLETLPMFAA
jgi:hypothetical protein